jgi:hypothetical protein
MRIALFLCGYFGMFSMKNLEKLYENIDRNDVDIFVHTYTEKFFNHPVSEPLTITNIQDAIPSVKKISVEDIEEYSYNTYPRLKREIRICNKLRHEYEKELGITYDLIIRSLFDCSPSLSTIPCVSENSTCCDLLQSYYQGTPESIDILVWGESHSSRDYKLTPKISPRSFTNIQDRP